jgi:hypothetical protein
MITSPYLAIRKKVLFEYLDKYPDTASRTLARIINREQPILFNNEDHVRTYIRIYRGKSGDRLRRQMANKKYYKNE